MKKKDILEEIKDDNIVWLAPEESVQSHHKGNFRSKNAGEK